MDVTKLLTIGFDKNVGPVDRVVRVVVGAAAGAAGWSLGLPLWASVSLTALGALTMLTGVLSKCSIYYLLGYSTCPIEPR